MIYIITFILALSCYSTAFASSLTDKISNASDSQLKSLAKFGAEGISKDAPFQVDSATRVLSAAFVSKTNTFIYYYETTVELNPSVMRPRVAAGVCTNPVLRAFLEKDITYKYHYVLPSGAHTLTISVVASDCK